MEQVIYYLPIVIALVWYFGFKVGEKLERETSSKIITRQKLRHAEKMMASGLELEQLHEDINKLAASKAELRNAIDDKDSEIAILKQKIDDLVGDTAHLIDEAVELAVEPAKKPSVRKKRKYTRKRKPAAKK